MNIKHVVVLLSLALSSGAAAQGTRADYERAATLGARVSGKVLNRAVSPRWISPKEFWYRVELSEGRRAYWRVDAEKATKSPLFEAESLAKALSDSLGRSVDAERLPIDDLEPTPAGVLLMVRDDARLWLLDQAGSLSAWPMEKPSAFHLPFLPGPRESRGGGGRDTSITFVNRTQSPVTLHWVDPSGARRAYGRVGSGESRRQHTFPGHVWVATTEEGKDLGWFEGADRPGIALIGPAPVNPLPNPSAAGVPTPGRESGAGPEVFVKDHNLWLKNPRGGADIALTTDGTPEDRYDGRVFVSPTGTHAVAIRTTRGSDRRVQYIQSSPPGHLQPRLRSYAYLKPGDEIPMSRPRLFDLSSRREIPVSEELFPTPWSIDHFRWEGDSSRFTFLYNQRGHRVVRLLSIDAASGAVTALIREEPETFVDYAAKTFLHHLEASGEIIWMSERSGNNHLYLIDSRSGAVKNAITSGPWVVRQVDRVDESKRQIELRVMGAQPGQDPYHVHFARVNFDGSGFTLLTQGDGTHTIVASPTGEYLINTYSRADLPPVTELRRSSDGSRVLELERADWSPLLATGWRPPQVFVAKGRDGTTGIWGLIRRPTNFDPTRKYPVIEAIYAGPHDHHVPKSFDEHSGPAELAELGFIVVQIDGMGTNWRSKSFHDAAWKNLRDAGFPDRIAWLRAAAAKHPEMDLENHGRGVGIYGGSAGGQNAMAALLWHGDFYKVAAADCGCHDNRMDKIWWNELWMSWPIGPHYEASSNAVNAHLLRPDARLLLTVGEMDENVDPASTMQVVNALIKADKDFDLIVLPNMGHGAGESPYGQRRRQDHFVRHLLGVEPRR
jgi:dipeptidyl aminopeptidase/acylaminoacyl peptidase